VLPAHRESCYAVVREECARCRHLSIVLPPTILF
jgi:hypothetical protein